MAIPNRNHDDWPWPFKGIPRRLNARESDVPPRPLWHSEGIDKVDDIPPRGHWVVTRGEYWWEGLYFAITTESGWHARIGTFRYDYVDRYYTYPTLTVKRQ